MSKQLQLSIPTPCHENWDAMTPSEKGKFCGSCQKQVVDFSNMSDRQVAEFFKKPSTGSVCGRFMTDQLERDIEIPKKRIPWLKYFFQFAIPAFLLTIKSSSARAQGFVTVVKTNKTSKQIVGEPLMAKCTKPLMGDTLIMPEVIVTTPVKSQVPGQPTDLAKALAAKVSGPVVMVVRKPDDISETRDLSKPTPVNLQRGLVGTVGMVSVWQDKDLAITGKVVDENGDILPGASVIIKGTHTGVTADNNGAFYLRAKKGDVLQASGPGLEIKEVKVGNDRNIIISVRRFVIGGVSRTKSKIKKELKQGPLIPATSNDPAVLIFKIFPNPIESGNSINIEIQKMEEGYYSVQLLDQSGQSVHQQEIWIDAEARLLNIDVPPVAAGSYFLSLTNKRSGKRSAEKIIIR
ncbi:MAG TPA: carboxypeptidase-like regulatory domain-containing protein [Chitinophagaceae bacterium]|nr:carboxypeptidase-like regulatory domain-containing protein [Chitinophagaceae bacterium]